jgi:D-alanyl-D-alanine carboxypeptidase (penicillin-binding protein 5/6)
MLYGLMLKSANDVAHSLGRDNAGTMPLFAEKMTRRAHELGATRTNFMNPHGLHHVAHFTTPRDLALITRAAMQQPLFRRIVSTQKHPWVTVTGVPIRELFNHNKLLTRFEGCTGVKTGFTRPAMNVLASAALRGNREVIAAVMHSDRPGQWEDSMQLLSYGLENEAALKKLNSSQPP